jgi:hypothetical protein
MRVLLELIRIIILFIIFGGIIGSLLENLYSAIGTDTNKYGWMVFIAIFSMLFVLYRNKLQFTGWYKGKGRERLSKKVSNILTFSIVILLLLLLPPILSFLLK